MERDSEFGDITCLLAAWRGGDTAAINEIVTLSYPKLHNLAESFLRREAANQTLQATALVNELYMLFARQRSAPFQSRQEFFSFAAYLIRLILRKRARDRKTAKRGGDNVRVPLSEELSWIDAAGEELLDLDRALDELAQLHERKVRILELTVFLGCSTEEAAELMGLSKATADRDLRFTKAWLHQRLRPGCGDKMQA